MRFALELTKDNSGHMHNVIVKNLSSREAQNSSPTERVVTRPNFSVQISCSKQN